jgi:hypothetical protein
MNPDLHPPHLRRRRAARRRPGPAWTAVAAVVFALLTPPGLAGQDDGVRLGVTFGGTGFVGLTVEIVEDTHAAELTVGTWSFRDLTLSLVGREYFGAAALRPVAGLGLWSVISFPREGQRSGVSVVARAPVGFDWRAAPGHFVSVDLNVNRALWIRHRDPEDDAPPNARLIPLPGFGYRWRP